VSFVVDKWGEGVDGEFAVFVADLIGEEEFNLVLLVEF
jgi:hypothetical protein